MPRNLESETVDFAAAAPGGRVRLINLIVALFFAASVGGNIWLALSLPAHKFWPVVLAPLVGLPVVLLLGLFARVESYRLAEGELQVLRWKRTQRFALAGLTRVETGHDVLKGMRKRMGNDGLGAITGEFRSKRLGDFELYATDLAKAVVLHWPTHRLAISPEQPAQFVEAIAARTGCRVG